MRYRVDDLAEACGVSVDTVRFYQTKGLLPRPEREGRVAWYDDRHRACLDRIRELKDQGFTLAMIERVLAGTLDPTEEALAGALSGGPERETLSLAELAERTGTSTTLLEALVREGLLTGQPGDDGEPRFTAGDVEVVQAGATLLAAGVPVSELLDLARRHSDAMRATAEHAVDLFARFVRDPIRAEAASDAEAAEATVEALHAMLPAAGTLVTNHFRRLLIDAARARLESG